MFIINSLKMDSNAIFLYSKLKAIINIPTSVLSRLKYKLKGVAVFVICMLCKYL